MFRYEARVIPRGRDGLESVKPVIQVAIGAQQSRGAPTVRRTLVLTDEAARHPFRASLPAHVREEPVKQRRTTDWRLSASDVRGFATTYFASFAAVLAFIA